MDWSLGYSARYYMTWVDWGTMKDLDRIEITGGSIKRSLTDLRESADVDCTGYDNTAERIVRIWLDTKQEGSSSHIPLFTGLAACPTDKFTGRRKTNSLECYSMLKIASDVMLPRGWYAPIEANSGQLLRDLLGVVGVDIHISDTAQPPNLTQAIIAEQGETKLSMADKILDSMSDSNTIWRMRLDGYGEIYIEPISSDPLAIFDSMSNDVIETDVTVSYDWFSAPNILRCTLDDSFAIAKDENEDSPLSIQNRHREVWLENTDVTLNTNETLGEYAQRMLKYYQQISTTVSYTRRFIPDIYPADRVRINYPAQNLTGTYMISDQTIDLGYNARTSEEVIKL